MNQQLFELKESLPASLQVLEGDSDADDPIENTIQDFLEEIDETSSLMLLGFWEPEKGFDKPADQVPVGEVLKFAVADAGPRAGVYIARDRDGQSVGMLMNTSDHGPYQCFTEALIRTLQRSQFQGTLVSFDEDDADEPRIYFRVRVDSANEQVHPVQ